METQEAREGQEEEGLILAIGPVDFLGAQAPLLAEQNLEPGAYCFFCDQVVTAKEMTGVSLKLVGGPG